MRTQLWMGALQMGQSCRLGAHMVQTRWPQGTKTMPTVRSRHTLQVRSSRSLRSCSSASWAPGGSRAHRLHLSGLGLHLVPPRGLGL